MSLSPALSVTEADPTVRSDVYKLLSLAFKYPTQELFEAYQNGEFLSELFESLALLPHLKPLADARAGMVDAVRQELAGVAYKDFASQYINTFDVGTPQPPCPPYEGTFRPDVERTTLLIEVAGFYQHFGLKITTEEGKREQPDHLTAELEYLHFMTFKEYQMRTEGNPDLLKGYILAQKDFIERHLVSWLPKFSEKMQTSSAVPMYSRLAELTSQVASAEFDLVRSMLDDLGYDPNAEVKEGTKDNGGKIPA